MNTPLGTEHFTILYWCKPSVMAPTLRSWSDFLYSKPYRMISLLANVQTHHYTLSTSEPK